MALTIRKPAVIEPSHMPSRKRTTNNPVKFLQTAWHDSAIPQMKILMLFHVSRCKGWKQVNQPHPFSNWESLKSKILRVLEKQIAEVEDGPQPVITSESALMGQISVSPIISLRRRQEN